MELTVLGVFPVVIFVVAVVDVGRNWFIRRQGSVLELEPPLALDAVAEQQRLE